MKKHIIIPSSQNEITKDDLLENLNKLGIHKSEYSLDGNFNPDTIVLWHNYYKWEVYQMDEKGNKNLLKVAYSEKEAFCYIHELFRKRKS